MQLWQLIDSTQKRPCVEKREEGARTRREGGGGRGRGRDRGRERRRPGEEKEARAKCNSMPYPAGRRSGPRALSTLPRFHRFHHHGDLRGNHFLQGGSLRGALRLAAANANPSSSPAGPQRLTVTSTPQHFCALRCHWRGCLRKPILFNLLAQVVAHCSYQTVHLPGALPLSGIVQDQLASLMKILRFS